eukprot:jgi/Orpsp1_1/1189809/evm.model.d7180000074643.1
MMNIGVSMFLWMLQNHPGLKLNMVIKIRLIFSSVRLVLLLYLLMVVTVKMKMKISKILPNGEASLVLLIMLEVTRMPIESLMLTNSFTKWPMNTYLVPGITTLTLVTTL